MKPSDIINDMANEIERLATVKKSIESLIEILPAELTDIDDAHYWPVMMTHSLCVSLPFDRNVQKKICNALERDGWKVFYERTERDCENDLDKPSIAYHAKDIKADLTIFWNPAHEHATCRRHQLGTVLKQIPVYEFSCKPIEAKS